MAPSALPLFRRGLTRQRRERGGPALQPGHAVSHVWRATHAADRLGVTTVSGSGTAASVLGGGGIEEADVLAAATGEGKSNLVTALWPSTEPAGAL